MTRVVFLLVPRVHLLDLAGPAQVFSTAADYGLGYELHFVAEREDVPSAQGLPLRAAVDWPPLEPDDLLIVPGWRSPTLRETGEVSAPVLRRLRDHHAAGGTVASVCAGADALGRAGLLDGRRCTTHHDVQDELALRHPRATVVRDVLYVVDGRVVTSAGIASGIDLALHLLAVRHGPGAAARVARQMVVYARRNGDEQQVGAMLRHRGHLSDAVHRAQDLIDARFTDRLTLMRPRRPGRSQRTHPDSPLHRLDRAHPAALPAGTAGRARRAPDLAGHDRGVRGAGGGVPGRADAAATAGAGGTGGGRERGGGRCGPASGGRGPGSGRARGCRGPGSGPAAVVRGTRVRAGLRRAGAVRPIPGGPLRPGGDRVKAWTSSTPSRRRPRPRGPYGSAVGPGTSPTMSCPRPCRARRC